ncbi:MAG: glycosyltransferase family 4 protein [Melioribacter sp.]|nr:glycosyltransferase family 4 protein [Melioribacter sp.]
MRILELTEPFQSEIQPTTGLFIKEHAEHISKICEILLCVFIRIIPPKRILMNFKEIKKWSLYILSRIRERRIKENDYEFIFIPFISLPRPIFEFINIRIMKLFYSNAIYKIAIQFRPQVIVIHWVSPLSLLAINIGDLIGIPVVINVHEDPDNIKLSFPHLHQIWLKALKLADAIVVHSEVNKNKLVKLGINSEKIFKVYLGINEIFLNTNNEQVKDEKDIFVILAVSHLSDPCKRIDHLLRSFPEIKKVNPKTKLVVVGNGRLKKSLEELSFDLGIQKEVIFKGALAPMQVKNEMVNADLFVLPSIRESFGLVFIEAIASGLPVIGYKEAGAIPELEKLGIPIVKLDEVTPKSISNAVIRAMINYEEINRVIVKNQSKIANLFSWRNHALSYIEVLKKVCKQKGIIC